MDFSYYLFALFIFLCILVIIWLVARVVRAGKKSAPKQGDKDSLFKLYQSLEEMMNSLEEYVEKAREDMARDTEQARLMLAKMEHLHAEVAQMQAEMQQMQMPLPPVYTYEPSPAKLPKTYEPALVRTRVEDMPVPPPARTERAPAVAEAPRAARVQEAQKAVQTAREQHREDALPPSAPQAGEVPEGALKKNRIVRLMKDEGLSDEQIAKELGISRGEVALILGMKDN